MATEITLSDGVLSIVTAATGALIGWVWALWKEHHALERQVTKLEEKADRWDDDRDEIKDDVRRIRRLVEKLCLKLHVPAVDEDE